MKNELRPRLRFPEFKKENAWIEIKLSDMGSFQRGLTYSVDDVSSKGLLVLRSSNIQDGNLILDKNLVFISKDCPKELLLKKGDIVICMSNGSKTLVGKNAEYSGNCLTPVTIGAFCSLFRPKSKFAKLIFQTKKYDTFISLSIGGGSINNLKNSALEEYISNIPINPKEQQKIADCLSSIDELINAQKQKLDELENHKKGLMQQLFPKDGKFFPKLQFVKSKKEKYDIVKLGEVAEISAGNSAPQDISLFNNGIYPFCRTSDVGKVHISSYFSDISEKLNEIKGLRLFPKETILFPKSGASILLNHRVLLSVASYVSSHLATIFRNGDKVLSKYLFYALCNIDTKCLVPDSNYPSLKISDIEQIKIPLPTLSEQQKIADCLSSIDELINVQKQKLDELKNHKKGLIQQLFPNTKE